VRPVAESCPMSNEAVPTSQLESAIA